MAAVPSELGTYSTRRLLLWRVRVTMLICAGGGVFFGTKALLQGTAPSPQFWTQVIGSSMAVAAFFLLRQRWALRWAYALAIFSIGVAYVLTAIAGILSPTGEYATTSVLFIGAAMTTATIVPWGGIGQAITVVIGAASLAAAVLITDGNLHVLSTDAGAATAIAFTLSVITAYEVNRYRFGHRRELLMRQRGELAIKRMNAWLERRVAERTAELAREAAERIESQRRLADTVDHSNAMISLKDPAGRYLLVNRELEVIVGRPRDEIIGRTDAEVFAADVAEGLRAHDEDVLRRARAVSFEQELVISGATRTFVTVKFPLHDAAGATYGVGSVATDIGRMKQLQEDLRQHQDELAHVLRLHTITEMAAGLAHEINQPLCAITNYAQGGVQRLRNGNAKPRDLLHAFQRIADEGLRAGEIIRGIRNLVQRASPSAAIDVNALATEAVRLLASRARQQSVTMHLDRALRLPRVCADGAQIEQVILNLMLNGVEAIEGSTSDRRELIVATRARGGGVEVNVSDTGAGLAPAVAEKLFNPFVTTKAGGLGLGLAISRSIVELHGGRLWATPNAATGTTFHFWLPAAHESSAEEVA